MPLVDSKAMLKKAMELHYAVPAFNVENLEMAKAVIEAAQESGSPVILQTTPASIKYCGCNVFFSLIKTLSELSNIDVALHLDHSETLDEVLEAIKAGYTSIMIDGSKLSYSENVALTQNVVNICRRLNISTEAELGGIGGRAGFENVNLLYTDVDTALDFVQRTNVDSLAVAVGTIHGVYKQKPNLDIDRILKISKYTSVPLVLHGASGVPDDQILNAIQSGICKINIATDLRVAYTNALKSFLSTNVTVIDPRKYGIDAIEKMKEVAKNKISLFGSSGRNISFMPKAIVFDFDGVIVDSEKYYQKAFMEAFEFYGVSPNKNDLLCFRSLDSGLAEKLCDKISDGKIDYKKIREKRNEIMALMYSKEPLKLKEGIYDVLEYLHRKGYPLYIASSSDLVSIKEKLIKYKIYDFFTDIFSAKGLARGKPYPDIYELFINKTSFRKTDVLVFEDSPNGIESALQAGVNVAFIKDLTPIENRFSKKVLVCLEKAEDIKNFL